MTKDSIHIDELELSAHIGAQSRWKLIESLAQEIATRILAEFDVQSLQIELRKYILPDTNFVAVRIAR